MAVFVVILLVSVGCWILVFSKSARAKMPLVWVGRSRIRRREANLTEEQRELEDGLSVIGYLLMAMVSTLLWLTALAVAIFRE
jgi:hypothetical protein